MGEGDGSSNEDAWSEADKDFIAPCIGLVKMTKICLKKLTAAVKKNGQCDTERNTCQLDDLVEHVEKVQPAVDDLICGLYPPLRHQDVKNKVSPLLPEAELDRNNDNNNDDDDDENDNNNNNNNNNNDSNNDNSNDYYNLFIQFVT